MIRLIDMKHKEFLKASEKNVTDPIQLYKDNTAENTDVLGSIGDVEIKELFTSIEDSWAMDSMSTLEDFKKWIREVVVEQLETERKEEATKHAIDDLKQYYVDDIAESDTTDTKEDTKMEKRTKINSALLTTFPLINCCGGELCHTTDGDLIWLLEMDAFGNPEDKCWKLILELDLPVYYQNGGVKNTTMETTYTRISNPADPKWFCSPHTGKLGFYPDGTNPVIANFNHIGILLINPFEDRPECHIAYGASKRPVYTEDAIRAVIDCICEHYGRVPKELVSAIVNYYRED